MPIEEQKGLTGMPGINQLSRRKREEQLSPLRKWSDLSIEEREKYLDSHPSLRTKPFKYVSNVYDNENYVREFGKSAFRSKQDKAERDDEYQTAILRRAAENIFGDESEDVKNVINTLSAQGLRELIDSGYYTQYDKDLMHQAQESSANPSAYLEYMQMGRGTAGVSMIPYGINLKENAKVVSDESVEENNNDILSRIYNDDNRRAESNATALTNEYMNQLTKLGSNFVEENFSKIYEGYSQELGYGDATIESKGIGLYNMFKDRHEMRDFGYEEKKEYLAKYYALNDIYKNPAKAAQVVSTSLQDYIHYGQYWYDWWGSMLSGIGTKMAADIFQTWTGIHGLTGAASYGDDWLANYLQGLDENGEERPWYDNERYWNGVDMYNTFSNSLIKEIEDNGGISPYNWISKAGHERNVSAALNEGGKMLGYMIAQILIARGVNKAWGAVAKSLNPGAFRAGQFLLTEATPAQMRIMKYYAPLTSSMLNAVSISTGYAKGSFDSVLQDTRGENEVMKEAEAAQYVRDVLSRIDTSGLSEEELSAYAEYLRQEKMKELNASDLWQAADRQALREAASAYERNATIEFLRMSGINYLFKSWLNDKSVRRAMNSNYPGLGVGKSAVEGEELAMRGKFMGQLVDPKVARYYGAAKAVWGGFESNYFDDVWSNYSKAFSKGRYNQYIATQLNGESAAYSSDWIAGFVSGVQGFEDALVDPQSWYDGFIGALGTIEGGMIRFANLGKGRANNYDANQLAKYASLSGMSVQEYVRQDYDALTERLQRANPDASAEQIGKMVSEIKNAYNINKMIQEGNIEELSFVEKLNNYFGNALTQEYSDARAREREFKGIIDAGNKAISEKRAAIDDVIRVINSVSEQEVAMLGSSVIDMQEAKKRKAFELIRTLQEWSENPILSQSEYVQTAQRRLQQLADGNITQEDIDGFLADADNKSEAGTADAQEFARQRLQENAKQLLEVQKAYKEAYDEAKQSKQYNAVKDSDYFKDLITELVFHRVMFDGRESRMGEMNKDVQGTTTISTRQDYTAKFGSEKGYQAHMKALDSLINDAKEALEDDKDVLKKAKRTRNPFNRARAVRAARLAIQESQRRIDELNERKSAWEEAFELGIDFDRVLSEDEILSLNPEDRAAMLDPKNRKNYSKEQQAVIRALDAKMKFKDPDYLQKVQDIAELEARNKDLMVVDGMMKDNPLAALDYFNYAREIRKVQAENALRNQVFERKSIEMENAPSAADRIRLAKGTGYGFLKDYIDKHPEHKDELSDALNILKLKEDFKAATQLAIPKIAKLWRDSGMEAKDVENGIAVLQRDMEKFKADFNNLLKRDDIQTEQDMMDALEDYLVNMNYGRDYFEKVMEEVVTLNHQRNATKIQEAADRKAAEEQRRKQAEEALGKNYGFDEYNKGDIVYHKDGRVGTVMSFSGTKEDGKMKVAWTNAKPGELSIYDKNEVNSSISKTKPAASQPAPAPTPSPTPTPAPQQAPVVTQQNAYDITPDGQLIIPSEEEQAAAASMQSPGSVIVLDSVPEDMAFGTFQLGEYRPGLLVGDGMYEYDLNSLMKHGVQERRAPRNPNDPMSAFFNWLDSRGIKLQEIIDNELGRIFRANPDVPVKFMIVNEPGVESHIVEVLDYEGAVQKIHDDTANDKYGGIVTVGGKRYLVIGTLGYRNGDRNPFLRVANLVRDGARANHAFANGESLYVHQEAHTKIARIGPGLIFKQAIGETEQKFRTLGELFADSDRNPGKINFKNAVLGIMYANKYLITNRTPTDGLLFPPGRSASTIGKVFIFVKAPNGNYSPIALRDKLTIRDIKDGEYKNILLDTIRDLGSTDFNTRHRALVNLGNMIVMDDKTTIKVGNDNLHKVTIFKDGSPVWSKNVTSTFPVDELTRVIFDVNFMANITQGYIENETAIKMLDEAGLLQTDASALRTTNASFDVFEVDEKGNPMEIPIKSAEPDTRKENESKVATNTLINGNKYRLIDGDYYDALDKRVEDKALRFSIHWGIRIARDGMIPSYVTPTGIKFYITNPDKNNPGAISVDKAGNATQLSQDKALGLIEYTAKIQEEERRRIAAEEEAEKLMAIARIQREGLQGFVDPSEVDYTPQQPPASQQQPTLLPPVRREQKEFAEDPNKPTDKSLRDLQADKKVVKFAVFFIRRNKDLLSIAREKVQKLEEQGQDASKWKWEGKTMNQIQEILKEMIGPTFDPTAISNEDTLLDIIRNCR